MSEYPSIFSADQFVFPYQYKFPGQASDEHILFVTRENPVMLVVRLISIAVVAAVILAVGSGLGNALSGSGSAALGAAGGALMVVGVLGAFATLALGGWWTYSLWKKSLAFITTKRLTKIIYTTPFNRHSLSLPLEMVVDTGSYSKGFVQALLRLGTFTARSSASSSGAATDDPDRINKKYFYIENISIAEDLQHYVNKVLTAYRQRPADLPTFRPFIPHLKGEARKEFLAQWPGYWS